LRKPIMKQKLKSISNSFIIYLRTKFNQHLKKLEINQQLIYLRKTKFN